MVTDINTLGHFSTTILQYTDQKQYTDKMYTDHNTIETVTLTRIITMYTEITDHNTLETVILTM